LDVSQLLFVGFLWFAFQILRERGKASSGAKRPPVAPPDPGQVRPLPTPAGTDPTQIEGSRLEGLLRDLNRTLDEVAQVKKPAPHAPERQPAPTVVTPEAVSREGSVRRTVRTDVDQDDSAAQVAARRIAAAEARNTAVRSPEHTAADHKAFDRRIRQEPADHTAVRTYTPKQLSDAIVWREILGPPVSLRDSTSTVPPADIG